VFAHGDWAAGCGSCDGQAQTAANLEAAIAASEPVFHLQIDVGSPEAPLMVTMDCLEIFPGDDEGTALLGTFHSGQGGADGHNALYLAQATLDHPGDVPGTGRWSPITKLSPSASMGYLKQVPGSDEVLLAFELETHSGNRIVLRLYEDRAALGANAWLKELQLDNSVTGAGSAWPTNMHNLGTPSIASVVPADCGGCACAGCAVGLYFHYYTTTDLPGRGSLSFPPAASGAPEVASFSWQASFAEHENNAMRMAQADGKIGARAQLDSTSGGGSFLLYEAQMAEAGESYFGWLSWRLLLYQRGCVGQPAAQLGLAFDSNLVTLANPHATVVGDWMYVTAFVPSEPFDAAKAASYAECEDHAECSQCSSCADNPMVGAGPPAAAGPMITSIRVSQLFG